MTIVILATAEAIINQSDVCWLPETQREIANAYIEEREFCNV